MRIPVAFITDSNFIMQTGVAVWSLIKNKQKSTQYDIYIIMSEPTDEDILKLDRLKSGDARIHYIKTSLDKYAEIKQLAHIPISCLLKFDVCDLIAEEEKIIYIDGDVYVRGDLSELYSISLNRCYCGAVLSLDMLFFPEKQINAGVMLFDAKKMRDNNMSKRLAEKRISLGNQKSMDQQTFNLLIPDKIVPIPAKYNCVANKLIGTEKNRYSINQINKLYGTDYRTKQEMVADAIIIHYATTGKPWSYKWVACSSEWYKCYLSSPFGIEKLHRQSLIESRVKGAIRNYKEAGIKAVIRRIRWYIAEMFAKNEKTKWG